MCWNRVLCAVGLFVSVLMGGACVGKEDCGASDEGLRTMELKLTVRESVECAGTRSILPEESIENMITEVTLASYDGSGQLVNVLHYDSPEASMLLYVSGRSANNVYALVNMGDMTDAFPSVEAGVADIVYMLDSYEDVSRRGIPMCGVLKGCVYEKGKVGILQLERLFAKLNVRILHTGLDGGQTTTAWAYNLANRSLYVRQANRRLCPFAQGGSRAEVPSDIAELSDYNSDLADTEAYKGSLPLSQLGPGLAYVKDTVVVLYVPENIQGVLLPGNENPLAKVAENVGGDAEGARAGLCTYMEYNATKPNRGEGYYGDLMYRCYIGEDNVSDFSIRRNCRYDLTMSFTDEGFTMDSWKVVRGENWVDTRTLYFVGGPFFLYPGTTMNALVHYNRTSSSTETGSTGSSSEWKYEFDEEAMKKAGLTCTFMGDAKIVGGNGYSDYYFRIKALDDARVGASFPITVSLKDGTKSDVGMVCVASVGSLTPIWDFRPRYISQAGTLTVGGAVESKLPLKVEVSDGSVVGCHQTGDASFRFVGLKEGRATVHISNSDGSQTAMMVLDISVPQLKVSDVYIALSPDGKKGFLDYHYEDAEGNPLAHVEPATFLKYLKPVVVGCDYIETDVSESSMELYIAKLYSAGELIDTGSYYQLTVAAADCRSVGTHSIRAYVVDPFDGIDPVSADDVDDYTLLGLASVPEKVREHFSSELAQRLDVRYEIPPVDADAAYVSTSLDPVWAGEFSYGNGVYGVEYKASDSSSSKGASVRVFQNAVTSTTDHSAGRHNLNLHVRNRHSGECLTRRLTSFGIYVHTAVGAYASFGSMKCNDPYGGTNGLATVAGVYNGIAGITIYNTASSDNIYFMDVSVEYLTPVDRVRLFDLLLKNAETWNAGFDALGWIRPSVSDGALDNNLRFLYSVCVGGEQRTSVCDEPYGERKGIGVMLYRALSLSATGLTLTDEQLARTFLGYDTAFGGGLGSHAPAYEIHDMNKGKDMSGNIVSKNYPYYFSPSSCPEYRDSSERGYHVVHSLNALVPSSSGWINLL